VLEYKKYNSQSSVQLQSFGVVTRILICHFDQEMIN